MKAAAYLRVSSSGQTPGNQLPAIEAYARSKGYELVEIYSEDASAWKGGHQKEFARLLKDLRSGKRRYDVLLIWALDRLSREGPLRILQLIDNFKRLGCRVMSLQEPWTEGDGLLNDILYSLVAWVAKFESDRRSERTKAGLARAVKEGKKLGRPCGARDKRKRRRSGYILRYLGDK